MGLRATCPALVGSTACDIEAHLDTDALEYRLPGKRWVRIPFGAITTVEAKRGALLLETSSGQLRLSLGKEAEVWYQKIRYPRGRGAKLGLKPGLRIAVLGETDSEFAEELAAVGITPLGMTAKNLDLVFFSITKQSDLARLPKLQASLQPAGAIWVLWPKGQKMLTETHVRDAALTGDLVDVKVVSLSPTLSGLKLVIRKERRSSAKPVTAAVELPDFFATALAEAPDGVAAYFASLPPSHKREYLGYITEAKKPETRTKRVAKSIRMLRQKAEESRRK